MVVIFGHSPIYGYLNTVQEYHFGKHNLVLASSFIVYLFLIVRTTII